MPIRKHNEVDSTELNVQPNNDKLFCETQSEEVSKTDDVVEKMDNEVIDETHTIEELSTEVPYSKNKSGLDISFIEDINYRKFFSETDNYCLMTFSCILNILDKWYSGELYDENGIAKLQGFPTLQTSMCFTCIMNAKYETVGNLRYISLDVPIGHSNIAVFKFLASHTNKNYREIVRKFGKNFTLNDLLGEWVYIELYFDKNDPDLYVKKFRFMDDKSIDYLEAVYGKFVDVNKSIPRALFTLNTSKYLKEL